VQEVAIMTSLLGDPKTGKIPIEYLKVLVGKRRFGEGGCMLTNFSAEEERLPYQEGWRPGAHPIVQKDVTHSIFSLIHENKHKAVEALEVGLGTVHAVESAVTSILPTYCVIM
jgi:hypothetical protein